MSDSNAITNASAIQDQVPSGYITARQYQVLQFVAHSLFTLGMPPTVRDITTGCHIANLPDVHRYLMSLKAYGYIREQPLLTRTYRVTSSGQAVLRGAFEGTIVVKTRKTRAKALTNK